MIQYHVRETDIVSDSLAFVLKRNIADSSQIEAKIVCMEEVAIPYGNQGGTLASQGDILIPKITNNFVPSGIGQVLPRAQLMGKAKFWSVMAGMPMTRNKVYFNSGTLNKILYPFTQPNTIFHIKSQEFTGR